jgi:hypothetical protein
MKRKLPLSLIYALEISGLAILAMAAWFVLKPKDTVTSAAPAVADLAATPAVAAAQVNTTRVTELLQSTPVPARTTIWQVTIPAWSSPLPTRPKITLPPPPPPRTVALPSPLPTIGTGALSVAFVRELSITNKALLSSPLLSAPPPHTDGKTLVGMMAPAPGRGSVVAIDLTTGQARLLADTTPATEGPQVSDRYVVWSDGNQLQVYDLQLGQKRAVGVSAFEIQLAATRVVYRVIENGEWHIKGYDLVGQKTFSVADDPGGKGIPVASKNWVVFQRVPKASTVSGAYYYSTTLTAVNLDTREQIQIGETRASNRVAMPDGLLAIDVPWVAWATGQLGESTLHLYNLQTRTSSTISLPMCKSQSAAPSGYLSKLKLSNGVVLFKCGDYPGQYLGYSIQRQVAFSIPIPQIKTDVDALAGWAIVGDRLIWVWNAYAGAKSDSHIYTAQILGIPFPPYP